MSIKTSIIGNESPVTLKSKTISTNLPEKKTWVRNSLWPSLPTIANDGVVGLYAVYPGQGNFLTLGPFTVGPGNTLSYDLGDGTTGTLANGTTLYHEYDYSDSDLYYDAGLPYKIAVVSIEADGVPCDGIDLGTKHNQSGLQDSWHAWLEIHSTHRGNAPVFSTTGWQARQLESLEVTITGQGTGTWSSMLNTNAVNLERARINISSTAPYGLTGAFSGCFSLYDVEVSLSGAHISSSCENMFLNCYNLVYAPLFDTTSVTTFSNMFNNCRNLQVVPVYPPRSSGSSLGVQMFNGCSMLREVQLAMNFSSNISNMFTGCTSLEYVSDLKVASGTNLSQMFQNCVSLRRAPNITMSGASNITGMFSGCTSLEYVPMYDTSSVTSFGTMFSGCSSLKSVPEFNTSSATSFSQMFLNCTSLLLSLIHI